MTINDIFGELNQIGIPFEPVNIDDVTPDSFYRFASIKNKIPNGIYFLVEYLPRLMEGIESSIIITKSNDDYSIATSANNLIIVVDNPQLTHYKLSSVMEPKVEPGIHPTAIIDDAAEIHPEAHIGPFSIIGKCKIEKGVQLMGLTKVFDNVVIKANTVIESNCSIGARGMAWIWDENGKRIRQPQIGGVIIEEDCYLGTDITIVRGSLSENTRIGEGTVMAHGTKIGHGAQIGKNVHMANNVSIAGNAVISERAFLGSGSIVSSNITISANSIVGAGTMVNKNFEEEYLTLVGVPAKILKRRNYLHKPKGSPSTFKDKN